jgi:hypothetical protein
MSTRWKPLLAFATIVVGYVGAAGPVAAPKFSDWSPPILVPNVNSAFADFGPAISKDGRSLYFSSNRAGGIGNPAGFGTFDIWVSQRAHVTDAWGTPVNLGPTINTNSNDHQPAFSRDGHWMFLTSDRPGGSGVNDLWASYRRHIHDDFGWGMPVNLGPNINTSFGDAGASYFANSEQETDDDGGDFDEDGDEDEGGGALLFFNSVRPPGSLTNAELYVSPQFSDASFGLPTLLSELNSPCTDARPSIRSNGLEIFFTSNRPVQGGAACATNTDLWVATRETLSQAWNTPENLGPVVNGPSIDQQPYISSDGRTLYFASAGRPGDPPLLHVYMTTRNKGKASSDLEE